MLPPGPTFGPFHNMWVSKLRRVKAVINDMADDPHVQGQAAQVAGVALLADGLVGLENPLDGKKSRAGIVGTLFLVVFGVVFIFAASAISSQAEPYEGGVLAKGKVIDVTRSVQTDSDGNKNTTCRVVVEYVVNGKTNVVEAPQGSSGQCNDLGTEYDVSYMTDNPGNGKVLDYEAKSFGLIFSGTGWFVLVLGVWKFFVRLAEIVAGAWLWLWGKRRKDTNPLRSDVDWMSVLQQAWMGDAEVASGSLSATAKKFAGMLSQPTQQPSTMAQAPPPTSPPLADSSTLPAAGWYADAASPTARRWWDGTRWTDYT
jgi:hypothetical protein